MPERSKRFVLSNASTEIDPAASLCLKPIPSKTPKLSCPIQSFLREDAGGRAPRFRPSLMELISLYTWKQQTIHSSPVFKLNQERGSRMQTLYVLYLVSVSS